MTKQETLKKCISKWFMDKMKFSLNEQQLNALCKQISDNQQLILSGVSKRYFLFECINADRQKLKKLIIAPDRGTAIADIETNYPYIEKWYSSEELNVC